MAVIDLGELRGDAAPEPAPRRSGRPGQPYRVLAVLLVALVTLAGATPAPRRAVATVPGGPGAEVFVAGARLYVVEPPDPDRGVARRLVAYRVTAAGPLRPLWRVPLPGGGVVSGLLERDGTVLLVGRSADDARWETATVDARTGRPGWRRSGVAVPTGDVVLLQTLDGAGEDTISRVDLATGRTLWSVATPLDGAELDIGPDGVDRIVLVPTSGEVEVLDAATGVRLVARDLRPGELPTRQRTIVAAGLLLVVRDAGGTVTGYGLDRLDRRWTASLTLIGYVERCGELLCAYRQTGGMWAVDPGSGAIRWTDPRWQAVLAAADGRLLVAGTAPAGPTQAVVEEATGRVVADVGDWDLVRRDDAPRPVLGVRRGDGELFVAELDPAAGGARVRDALRDASGDCRAGGDVVVCRRVDGRFGLWRLP